MTMKTFKLTEIWDSKVDVVLERTTCKDDGRKKNCVRRASRIELLRLVYFTDPIL